MLSRQFEVAIEQLDGTFHTVSILYDSLIHKMVSVA